MTCGSLRQRLGFGLVYSSVKEQTYDKTGGSSFHKRGHITGVNAKLSCFEHSSHNLPAARLGKALHEDDFSDYGNRP
jgi:hypothetical protein